MRASWCPLGKDLLAGLGPFFCCKYFLSSCGGDVQVRVTLGTVVVCFSKGASWPCDRRASSAELQLRSTPGGRCDLNWTLCEKGLAMS